MQVSPYPLPEWLQRHYPFQGRFLTLPDGQRMHYIDEGAGPVVLMLHGNPTWSFFYRNLIRTLRGRFRCIAPDHVGCGLSDKPQQYPYRLAQHVANIESLLEALAIDRFHLIVHDWGGAIGMGVATKTPGRVGRMVVMNTAAFRSQNIPLRINVCRIPGFGALAIRGFNAFARGATIMAKQRPLAPEVRRGFIFPYNNWKNRIATLRFVQDIPLHESHPSYPELLRIEQSLFSLADKPMLLAWGTRDWCFDTTFLAEWRRRFPHAQVIEAKKANHYLLEDAQELMPEIEGFLGSQPVNTD